MSAVRVIGIDPGPIPGIVVLDVDDGRIADVAVLQCSAGLFVDAVRWLCSVDEGTDMPLYVQVERFVTRGRSTAEQALTRDMVRDVQGIVESFVDVGILARCYDRPAVAVKPWATDARLERAGLTEATKGMRHARDAARHALFCAVHDAGVPDPLSKEFHR